MLRPLSVEREPERKRAIGRERESILAPLACRLVRSKATVNCDNVGRANGTTSRPCAICAKAPTGHRRGLAIPSESLKRVTLGGTGSPNVTLFKLSQALPGNQEQGGTRMERRHYFRMANRPVMVPSGESTR